MFVLTDDQQKVEVDIIVKSVVDAAAVRNVILDANTVAVIVGECERSERGGRAFFGRGKEQATEFECSEFETR